MGALQCLVSILIGAQQLPAPSPKPEPPYVIRKAAVNPANQHVYYLIFKDYSSWSGMLKWSEGETIAAKFNGHLVTINDATENEWVSENFLNNNDSLWLGLYADARTGKYLWISGQPGRFSNWKDAGRIRPKTQTNAYMSRSRGAVWEAAPAGLSGPAALVECEDLPVGPSFKTSRLPPPSGAKNLIFITHGWRGNVSWVNEMGEEIAKLLGQKNKQKDWEIVTYDWADIAGNGFPDKVLLEAMGIGIIEGTKLAERRYQHAHFITHSAGANLITYAARYLKRGSPKTTIHATFLDAYAPGIERLLYGTSCEWADQYFNHGDSLFLDWTEVALKRAHNLNITYLNPNHPASPERGHVWPREFYFQSISDRRPEWKNYGFALSKEVMGASWPPTKKYPLADVQILDPAHRLPSPSAMPTPSSTGAPGSQSKSGGAFNTEAIGGILLPTLNLGELPSSKSPDGKVAISRSEFSLQTSVRSWVVFQINLPVPAKNLLFDVMFDGKSPAESRLSVFLNHQCLKTLDKSMIGQDPDRILLPLGHLAGGSYTIGFHLDAPTKPASVTVSTIRLGR